MLLRARQRELKTETRSSACTEAEEARSGSLIIKSLFGIVGLANERE